VVADAPKPSVEPIKPLPELPKPIESVAIAPPAPAPKVQPPPPAPATPQAAKPPPAPNVDPETQARTLWRKAIDAEINQDFREAVSCYEQIQKLPADVQPPGLEVRLALAKKLLK
jgi:hypothetical protein